MRHALMAAVLALLAACQQSPAVLEPEIVARYPHDPQAFTQGLVYVGGRFYESTGLYGASSLREVVPETGEVLRTVPLDQRYFGEGLAFVDGPQDDRLVQLTWRSGEALVYDADTFERIDTFDYDMEGWGLCWDGEALWMSDGSAALYRRDPATFEILDTVQVTDEGEPLTRLNELECVGDDIYANVWQTDTIVRIDKRSGRVRARIDASDLLSQEERVALPADAVLNGIAYDPVSERFWLTGKLWPELFEVEFAPRTPAP